MVDYIKYKPYTSNNWFNAVKEIQKNRPWITKRITDSMTASQVETKMWIAEEMHNLKLYPENYVVLGGWFAHILTNVLIEELGAKFVMNYEIDKDAQYASFKFNRYYKENDMFRCVKKNVMTEQIGKLGMITNPEVEQRKNARDYGTGFEIANKIISYDCIINTSCEHMWHMKDINFEGLCAFQSNDFTQEDAHVNCVHSLEEFKEQTAITDVYYQGEKPFDDYNDCKRFMIIGRQ